ncbi:MAG: ribonuclease HII, partial [Polaribacter sp.]
MLKINYSGFSLEAGTDEAGRGCLCGPVVAAAVILPKKFTHPFLNDSKQLSEKKRDEVRIFIEKNALAFAVSFVWQQEIDKINILQASITGMHRPIDAL